MVMKIKFRVNNSLTKEQIDLMQSRLVEFIKQAGGAVTVSEYANVPIGTLKSVLGDSKRCISPKLANQLCDSFLGDVDSYFKREYLRPDVTRAQWARLDSLVKRA